MNHDVLLLRWAVGARLIFAGQNVFPLSIEPADRSPVQPACRSRRSGNCFAHDSHVDAEPRRGRSRDRKSVLECPGDRIGSQAC